VVQTFLFAAAPAPAQASRFELLSSHLAPEAIQAVAVDERHFYAIDNRQIAKYDEQTGALVSKWQGPADGPIIHLDSGLVMDGKIYCAHSNYPQYPMTSSVEIWDAETLKHVGTRSFGIHWGSLTWLDWHDGAWWAGFANYDQPYGPNKALYGGKVNTTIVKFDGKWQWQEAWTLPQAILDRFDLMSNSGGSWGPDGFLYLSGHDPAEVYKMRLPSAGSVLELVEAIPVTIKGQGIAWDRSRNRKSPGVLYGIVRATKQVTASRLTE
jgi:hypothetical protein